MKDRDNQRLYQLATAAIRVALIDNHRIMTDLLTKALTEKPRVEVLFTATNGLHMQEQLTVHGIPDIVVMDVHMPEMDGYLSVEWLRLYHPHVRILVLTAFDDPDMVAQMRVYEVEGFLSKADDHEELYHAILQVADTGVYHNERMGKPSRFDPEMENLRGQLLRLRERKYEFLQLICEDINLNKVADRMGVGRSAVKRYTELMYEQYGVHSRYALLRRLFETGILPLRPPRPDGH